jgi:hypothetical protein
MGGMIAIWYYLLEEGSLLYEIKLPYAVCSTTPVNCQCLNVVYDGDIKYYLGCFIIVFYIPYIGCFPTFCIVGPFDWAQISSAEFD